MSIPAAWHPDPTGRHDHRWWDGERWTEHVADAGQASIDRIDRAPDDTGDTGDATTESAEGWAGGADAGHAPGDDTPAGSRATPGDQPAPSGSWSQPGQPSSDPQPGQPDAQWSQPGQPSGDQWGQPGQPDAQWSQPGPPAGTWQPTGGGPPAAGTRTDGVAIAAIVVGILSLLISFVPFIGLVGLVGGIVGIVLGIVARGRIRRTAAPGSGQAITGIVTSALAIVVSIIWIAVLVAGFRGMGGFGVFRDYAECLEETGDQQLCDEQLEEDLERRFFRS